MKIIEMNIDKIIALCKKHKMIKASIYAMESWNPKIIMDSKTARTLEDIQIAILEIKSFFGTRPMSYDVYMEDIFLRRAVERNITIIGEAMNRLHRYAPDIEFSSTHSILEICNSGYDKVTDEMMWGIVVRHLPLLKAEVQKLMD